MISRRSVLIALAAGLTPLSAEAQKAGSVPRLGILLANSPPSGPMAGVLEAFIQTLRDLGHVDGQNIVLEYRWAENRYDRLPFLAAELARLNVDVIFASTNSSAEAAKKATRTIPVVFETLGDPLVSGLVPSLAHPGGNVTGVSGMTSEVSAKRLELLKQAVPRTARVGVLMNSTNVLARRSVQVLESAGRTLTVELRTFDVRQQGDLAPAFAEMARQRVDAFLVLADPMIFSQQKTVVDLAARHRLPAIYPDTRQWAELGGLMVYGPELTDLWRRAATYVDRILKGAKPADLPVEQPTKFELTINLRTAKALGLTMPPSILGRADQVIQ